MVIELCRTFSCTPSQLEREDASIMRYAAIVRLGTPGPVTPEVPYEQ